ncbi:asparagine synthase (glutamine-hydrolyzing) [Pseudomonas phytophila]|uniref:asparagine synthase (glutamine-hydrolyzing) n=1 Tax=Pseudomonas phytophila TaxID=2867264 RepID=A0ABY6FNG4_9PSED|nr:asparagine synthase (glutamine-hydrolyzing) [Pseudomonas phytophila]UXZ99286.1 asparagine synthase (glutamine-hydrolyzing) [Pseudomonas phytophila]
MCGIAGQLRLGQSTDVSLLDECTRMANAILHRGPDDHGVWVEPSAGVGLAHRRLAIVDLSPAGHQPMASTSGRYVMVFNGEIYNHVDLRRQLEKNGFLPAWRGHSDTETLLAAFDAWGVEQALKQCVGMFAIALWDLDKKELVLARDRLGEKPLYYGWQGQGNDAVFFFGSELKALRAHPSFHAAVDRNSLALYFRHNYIPAPHSIYQGVHKLQPGSILTVSAERPVPSIREYWSVLETVIAGTESRQAARSPTDAVNELEALLKSAVAQQMMADVPLGAFLSGGIDSSTVVALMQSQSTRPVKTFTIGFHEKDYNEAEHAAAVAKHLATDHTELYITPQEAMSVIPLLSDIYDEPFSDSSQIPTFLVSQLARQHVTVSLSGDAGDELFSGYTRYTAASKAWGKLSRVPLSVRRTAASSIMALSPDTWSKLTSWIPSPIFRHRFGDKLHKGAGVLASSSIDHLYHGLVSHWSDPAQLVIGGNEPQTLLTGNMPELKDLDPVERMMALDLLTYLPDDILTKVDRASMAVTLESRVPMLDHRVVEFAWQLPQSLKQRDGVGKWALRQVLYRHVPQSLIDRPKMGFGVPIDAWLRGPLREWAETLLDESRLRQEGYLHPEPIRQKWAEHLSGSRNWAYHLWDVLMFQAWLEKNFP